MVGTAGWLAIGHRQMTRLGIFLLMATVVVLPARAELWRCEKDGKTSYSDVPCQGSGRPLDTRQLSGNVMQPVRPPDVRGDTPASPKYADSIPQRNVCPTDREIANMQTQVSATTLNKKERTFIEAEIRRAQQCIKGQGTYSATDWKASREAVADQNNLAGRDREQARTRAEGMHSAANPIEGDRIQLERLAEEQRRATRAARP
jgi:hypothetical protein